MAQITWLSRDIVLAIHARSLKEHGGLAGLRDQGLLEAALHRPQQVADYRDADLFELACVYMASLIQNHPFVDGNKRTGFLAAYIFLGLNGYELQADNDEAGAIIYDFAAGRVTEIEMVAWLRAKCEDA